MSSRASAPGTRATRHDAPERLPADWLIVESIANWQVDSRNRFSYFGITKRFEKLASSMVPGDRLFTYVTGKSSFSDIRRVTKAGVRNLRGGGDYELSLPLCIDTEEVLVLRPADWLPVREIKDQLVLTKSVESSKGRGQIFRHTPRLLDPKDASLLETKLRERLQARA
jgi:hypothetical protein